MRFTIRQAERADAEMLCSLINAQSLYQNAPQAKTVNAEKIAESLFGAGSDTDALLCEFAQTVVAFSVISSSYSPWPTRNGLNLEALYCLPEYRDLGASNALLQHIARLAVQRQCEHIEWNVLDWDRPANDFYLSIDALPLSEWRRYRLGGNALKNFAEAEAY